MSKTIAFHFSETGASHHREGKICQDFSLSSFGNEYAVAIVCDGHGGNKYFRSDRGSRIAAEQTLLAIQEFMKSRFVKNKTGVKLIDTLLANHETFINQLSANIIYRWRECISDDFSCDPFSEMEMEVLSPKELASFQTDEGWVQAYGTTLIATVRTKYFWFGLHIGDGKCVTVNAAGEYAQPIPWDEKCFLNQTTSLCDEQALRRFRYYFGKEDLPMAIFIATDGVDDTFGTEEALYNFYQSVLQLFSEKGISDGLTELHSYLPQLSERGSKDDISIAGIINKNLKTQISKNIKISTQCT